MPDFLKDIPNELDEPEKEWPEAYRESKGRYPIFKAPKIPWKELEKECSVWVEPPFDREAEEKFDQQLNPDMDDELENFNPDTFYDRDTPMAEIKRKDLELEREYIMA